MCDLLWSDPEEIEGWGQSPRGNRLNHTLHPLIVIIIVHCNPIHSCLSKGAGYLFGGDVVQKVVK